MQLRLSIASCPWAVWWMTLEGQHQSVSYFDHAILMTVELSKIPWRGWGNNPLGSFRRVWRMNKKDSGIQHLAFHLIPLFSVQSLHPTLSCFWDSKILASLINFSGSWTFSLLLEWGRSNYSARWDQAGSLWLVSNICTQSSFHSTCFLSYSVLAQSIPPVSSILTLTGVLQPLWLA